MPSISDADAIDALAQEASDLADEATALAERIRSFSDRTQLLAPDIDRGMALNAAEGLANQTIPYFMSAANNLHSFAQALRG